MVKGADGADLPVDGPAEIVDAGVDPARLGRRLARARVGVALGAGGAKGWAHIEVLRGLARAGYVVDAVAGSSIGPWIGAWTALGNDIDAVEGLLRERFDDATVQAVFRRGGSDGVEAMTRVAMETTAGARFDDLLVPLAVVAADLSEQRALVLAEGTLASAVVPAMTVPGLHPPARRGRQRLVDAVVLTPVPTAALADVDVTVAVNLLARQALDRWPGAAATGPSSDPPTGTRSSKRSNWRRWARPPPGPPPRTFR